MTQRFYGWALAMFGDFDGALAHFQAAADFGYSGRALCWWAKGDKERAVAT